MRWVIVTGMYNVSDLATEFCTYHLGLGADQILIADYGSTDGTQKLLRPFLDSGQAQLVPIPTHHFASYDPSNALLQELRNQRSADWVSFLDPDEFLVGPKDLKSQLTAHWSRGTEAFAVQRYNMTAQRPVPAGSHYLSHLTLKIIATDQRASDATANLSSPWIFSRIPPKVMVSVGSNLGIITGDHAVTGSETKTPVLSETEILHYPIRGFAAFSQKIEDTRSYLAKNPEFGPGTGWHWRRWISLLNAGGMREEYDRQFLDPETVRQFLSEGRVVIENRLADWLIAFQPG